MVIVFRMDLEGRTRDRLGRVMTENELKCLIMVDLQLYRSSCVLVGSCVSGKVVCRWRDGWIDEWMDEGTLMDHLRLYIFKLATRFSVQALIFYNRNAFVELLE